MDSDGWRVLGALGAPVQDTQLHQQLRRLESLVPTVNYSWRFELLVASPHHPIRRSCNVLFAILGTYRLCSSCQQNMSCYCNRVRAYTSVLGSDPASLSQSGRRRAAA